MTEWRHIEIRTNYLNEVYYKRLCNIYDIRVLLLCITLVHVNIGKVILVVLFYFRLQLE